MKAFCCISLFLLASLPSLSQPGLEKWKWHGALSAALVNGGSGASGQVLVSAEAVRNDGWAFGASSGFDYYGYRSVPLSLDARRYFGGGIRQLFAQASAGANIAWPTESQRLHYSWWGEAEEARFSSGLCSDIGLGYMITNRAGRSLFLSADYGIKSMGKTVTETVWNGTGSEEATRSSRYTFHRVLVRIGVRF